MIRYTPPMCLFSQFFSSLDSHDRYESKQEWLERVRQYRRPLTPLGHENEERETQIMEAMKVALKILGETLSEAIGISDNDDL